MITELEDTVTHTYHTEERIHLPIQTQQVYLLASTQHTSLCLNSLSLLPWLPSSPPPSLFHTLDVATTPRQALSLPVGTQTRWQLCPSARLCSSWVHHNEKKNSFIHKTFLERNILANNGKSKPLNQELCLCECIVGKGKCFCCSKSELGPEIPFVSDVSEQKLRGHEP